MKAFDAGKRLRRAAKAGDAEAKPRQRHGRGRAEFAEPHDADRDRARHGLRVLVPDALALLDAVKPLAAVMQQHVQHHVFGHAHDEIGFDVAHDRHIGQLRIDENMLDPGAEREDRLQARQAGEQAARRVPGAEIGDISALAEAVRPPPDVALRRERLQRLCPGLRICAGDGEEDRGHHDASRQC